MNENNVALITGSATGVGRACAVRFAEEGFDIVVNYSRSKEEAHETKALAEAEGANVLVIQCDVSDDAAVQAMIGEVESKWGRLDVLVNNAGTTEFVEHKELDEMSEAAWDRILGVNLKGPFFCIRAGAHLLRASDFGAVVNVSSTAGIDGRGSSVAYCASKGGLNTMTKSLGRALGPEIRVNSVCPGPIDSRWLKRVMTDEQLAAETSGYPIPRPALPDDIADTVLYLSLGTTLTTGQVLVVDGGRTM
ncbi:MAG: SDR family oxidoreductase [Planctomycetes bacterium]|nr:SDR family oxidoreductase [Planctomycetota bacterium]MCH9724616.1 SDR family oxidoreductase [Planctomycetota bacterium]MCH9777905.1 SDR family oxidoreductase [Planctomycetota bacterium]MCH9792987.1 SDR family oxidoreductase [Planctomycetota bacterium]MDF1744225.1 SDR family NAD(P)-dependent oxidoreductase [Gimesia sp.]